MTVVNRPPDSSIGTLRLTHIALPAGEINRGLVKSIEKTILDDICLRIYIYSALSAKYFIHILCTFDVCFYIWTAHEVI